MTASGCCWRSILARRSLLCWRPTPRAWLIRARRSWQHFPGLAFDFVVGYDTLIRLFDARYYTDMPAELAAFFAHHRVIAANRAEATVVEVEEFVAREAMAFAHRIVVHEIPPGPASLSSTHARSLSQAWEAAADEIVTQVVSPAVADYISEHGLYGAASPPQSRIANRES